MCQALTDEERDAIRRVEESGAVQRWREEMIATGNWIACAKCNTLCRVNPDEENGVLHPAWCSGCDATFIEREILLPLIERLGHRGARQALRRLAAGEKTAPAVGASTRRAPRHGHQNPKATGLYPVPAIA